MRREVEELTAEEKEDAIWTEIFKNKTTKYLSDTDTYFVDIFNNTTTIYQDSTYSISRYTPLLDA